MNDRYNNLLNHDKWNRRLMNVYWACNALILVVELVIMAAYFSNQELVFAVKTFTIREYLFNFIFVPSSLIFLITAIGEVTVRLLKNKHDAILPYVISFTCAAFCAVLLIVHYNVLGIYVIYVMPIFFSLVYGNKRVLLFTFISSLIVFIIIYFGYLARSAALNRSDYRLLYDLADALTNAVMLLAAYLVGTIILSRFGEILDTVRETERSATRAEADAKARSLFLANMSHEIRTPMNGVIGFTELALDNSSLPEETRDYLDKIQISAEGLLGIIDGILDLSKIEAGKMALEKVPFSLGDVLRQCKIMNAAVASEKALELRFRVSPISEMLLGDPTRLRQALLNLLSNAVKFTDKGTVELIVSAAEDNGYMAVRFEVRDSGIGMTEEQLQRIFEPFVQADDSTTRKYGGTGLGLSITKNIVELMGGCLNAESEPGFGSRFFFDLRFELAHQPDTVSEEEKSVAENSGITAFQGTILVCEDNEMNQQVIRMHLSKFGLTPVMVANGKLGLDKYVEYTNAGQAFDLVFMDIHMPVMDGLEASRKLLKLGCKAPVIALTANAMAEDRAEYLKNGMCGCLVKPFVSAELYLCLKQYLKYAGTLPLPDGASDCDIHYASETECVINQELGLESCAGDEGLYQKICTEFLEKGGIWNTDLIDSMVAGDIDSAHRAAHTLSGRAATLGALRLSQAAREMEYALAKYCNTSETDHSIQVERSAEFKTLASNLEREMSALLTELADVRNITAIKA